MSVGFVDHYGEAVLAVSIFIGDRSAGQAGEAAEAFDCLETR